MGSSWPANVAWPVEIEIRLVAVVLFTEIIIAVVAVAAGARRLRYEAVRRPATVPRADLARAVPRQRADPRFRMTPLERRRFRAVSVTLLVLLAAGLAIAGGWATLAEPGG